VLDRVWGGFVAGVFVAEEKPKKPPAGILQAISQAG
jgi:hypothetical protein